VMALYGTGCKGSQSCPSSPVNLSRRQNAR
jgi:hypothetical protein